MIRVGMIGLGRMGSGIALNIAKAGFPLALYDTEEGLAQELRNSWVKNHDLPSGPGGLGTPNLHSQGSAADVMLASDVCLMCVHTEEQAIDALAGDDGLLTVGKKEMADKIIVDHGTVSPRFARKMADTVKAGGGSFLDAPVSGGPEGAKNGTLSVMIGGNEEHVKRCRPVLEAMGTQIEHMGPSGAGAAAKLVNQHLVISNTVAACEAYVLARSLGLHDTTKLRELLRASWGHSKMLDITLRDLLKVEESADGVESLRRSLAPIRTLAKDAAILARAAGDCGISIPLFSAARTQVDAACKSGFSDCSHAAMATVIEEHCKTKHDKTDTTKEGQ